MSRSKPSPFQVRRVKPWAVCFSKVADQPRLALPWSCGRQGSVVAAVPEERFGTGKEGGGRRSRGALDRQSSLAVDGGLDVEGEVLARCGHHP